jgi:nitrous oxidase accessory protein
MFGRNIEVKDNLIAGSAGAAGIGLGLKEAGNVTARGNIFVRNNAGVYLDTSPLYRDDSNLFEQNAFRLCDTAVTFHGSQTGNAFISNSFRDNRVQVAVEGGSDALGTRWDFNDWNDYAGYDLDGDGIGDIPYELRSLSSDLMSRTPSLQFFRGSPALALTDAVSHVVPLFTPRVILIDPHPRMAALDLGPLDAY